MTIHYHWMARREILEATEYYAAIRPSLGVDFAECLESAIERVARDPLQFELVRQDLRRCPVERFPYSVYFRVLDAESIQVVVVKHHSRRPGLGMRRR